MTMKVPEAFSLIMDLAHRLGVQGINELPGCWSHKVDDQWSIKINGHETEMNRIPPYHCGVEYNGWPAGLLSSSGGSIAGGISANEDTFISALKVAIDSLPRE